MSSPLSGFTAIPNPQMLAFMPIQSFLMMYFAGSGWQYGKRKISAKSNEEFNKLTMQELLMQHSVELKSILPTMEKTMNDVTPLVRVIIEQYGDFIKEALAALPKALQNIIGGGGEFENVPTTGGSGGNLPPQMASFLHYFKTLSDATKIDVPSGVLAPEEQTHAQRVALQAKENARVKRLQDLLFAKKKASERKELRDIIPAKHIVARTRSNVSLQSLTIERDKLTAEYRRLKKLHDLLPPKDSRRPLFRARYVAQGQKYANFFKMHGTRFQ